MERLARLVLCRPLVVVAFWAVVAGASFVAARDLSDLLTNRFSLPGTETERAEAILRREYGERSDGAFTLVAVARPGGERTLVPALRRAAARVAAAVPTATVSGAVRVSRRVATAVVATGLEPADAKRYTDDVRAAAGEPERTQLYVTGVPALAADLDPVLARDLRRGELIAVPLAVLILVFVFGTLAVALPFVLAGAAIATSLGAVWLAAHATELSTYVPNMVLLIGFGIAVDYSLLLVSRWREERRRGGSEEDALVRTLASAGRAVVFSGTAVAIGLAVMLALPFPFLRGFGVAGLLIPLASVACALTLLPALLVLFGDRLERVRLVPRALVERRERETAFWVRLSRAIMRRPLAFAVGTSALLLALAAPVVRLELTPGSNEGIPSELDSMRGLEALAGTLGDGALAPTEIVVDTGRRGGARSADVRASLTGLARDLRADPEVTAVRPVRGPPHVVAEGRYLRLQVIGRHEYGVPESRRFVSRLRERMIPAASFPAGVDVLAGGGPPGGVDFLAVTYDAFPWLVVAVLALTYVLLVRAFRSLLLPAKAIVLNLLSIGAAYGTLVLVFGFGVGEPLGLIPLGEIEGWLPVFLFAMLFGLSMDYEVFLVTRMREEWDAGRDNEAAVAHGLARTGRLVTAAGLIMVAAFLGFLAGTIVGLQQFGVGLAAAVLVDVTVIRALLVPSAMKLFGRWNWWLPERVARIFGVPASPLAATSGGGRRAAS